MKKQTFAEQVYKLRYSFSQGEFNDTQSDLWWHYFQYLPDRVFIAGIEKVILTRHYPTMPTIAEIAEACVGDHYRMIPAHSRMRSANKEIIIEAIMAAYKDKAQKQIASNDTKALPPASNEPCDIEQELRDEVTALRLERNQMQVKMSQLQTELQTTKELINRLQEQLNKIGSEEYRAMIEKQKERLKAQNFFLAKS